MKYAFREIRIVPIEKLMPHEMGEPKRTVRLEERLMADGFLKNPVIVGRVTRNDSKYLLLDGVNRVSALKNLRFKDTTAQIVDYFSKNVKVSTWCHLIYDFEPQILLEKIRDIKEVNLEKTNRKSARVLLKQNEVVCCLFFRNKDVFVVKSKHDLSVRASKLLDVINIYCESSVVHRVSETEARFLLRKQETATAAILFPMYKKKDIVDLAFNKVRLPPGVTRHIIPLRVLNFHVDLALLEVNMPLKDKNKIIHGMINRRIAYGKTRFYHESVLVFDD